MTLKALTLAALATAATLAGAGGAAAQTYAPVYDHGYGGFRPPVAQPVDYRFGAAEALRERETRLQGWIAESVRSGRLSFHRAREAQADLDLVRAETRRAMAYGGLDGWRAQRLNARLDALAAFVRGPSESRFGGYPAPHRW